MEPKKINWFTRILILLLSALIAVMVIYRYFKIDPKADITGGIIILLAFLIVIILSEVFDNFSVGEIIKLSKTVKEKEKEITKKENEITKVEVEKRELLSQIISLSANFSQKQSNTNIYGLPHDLIKQVSIQKAEPTEVEESKNKEVQEVAKEEPPVSSPRRLNAAKVEELALKNFFKDNNIDFSKVFREVKVQAFQGVDPISDSSPIFDAYLNEIDREVFFEVRQTQRVYLSSMFVDRIYVMLSKIFHYRNLKKTNAYLNVIIVEFPDDPADNKLLNRILSSFQPALSNSILRMSVVRIKAEEMDGLYE